MMVTVMMTVNVTMVSLVDVANRLVDAMTVNVMMIRIVHDDNGQ